MKVREQRAGGMRGPGPARGAVGAGSSLREKTEKHKELTQKTRDKEIREMRKEEEAE